MFRAVVAPPRRNVRNERRRGQRRRKRRKRLARLSVRRSGRSGDARRRKNGRRKKCVKRRDAANAATLARSHAGQGREAAVGGEDGAAVETGREAMSVIM